MRRVAGAAGHRTASAFQCCQPFLEHRDGRVGQPGIDESERLKVVQRRGMITITAFATIPASRFDVVGIAAGSLPYLFHQFMIAVPIGRLAKFGVAATIGYYGAPIMIRLFS